MPTVTRLLKRIAPTDPVRQDLQNLRAVLQAASERGAKFYLMVRSWGGGTNARVEAVRRGDLSALATKADPR